MKTMWAAYDIFDGAPLSFENDSFVIHCDKSNGVLHNSITTESHRIGSPGLHEVIINAKSIDSEESEFSMIVYAYFKDSNDNILEGPIELDRFYFTSESIEISQELRIPDSVKRLTLRIYVSKDCRSKIAIDQFSIVNGGSRISMLDEEIYYGNGGILNPKADLEICGIGNMNSQSASNGLLGRFIGINDDLPIETSSIIKLSDFDTFSDYFTSVKKIARKSAIYPARLAGRKGYFTSPFFQSCYIDDYLDINESSTKRQGKEMDRSYLRSDSKWESMEIEKTSEVIELNKERYPENAELFDNFKGPRDWGLHFGSFFPEEGHKQGDFQTDQRLVGYLYVRRFGEIASYSYIIGHANHLRNGIMYQMHFDLIELLFSTDNEFFNGIKYIFYSGHYQGESRGGIKTWGLRRWKEKLLFRPINLQTPIISWEQCDVSLLKKLAASLNLEYDDDTELHEILLAKQLVK